MDYSKMFPGASKPSTDGNDDSRQKKPVVEAENKSDAQDKPKSRYAGMFPSADSNWTPDVDSEIPWFSKEAAAIGAGGGYLLSGAGKSPMRPNPNVVAKSNVVPHLERVTGAPAGSVAQTLGTVAPSNESKMMEAALQVARQRAAQQNPLYQNLLSGEGSSGANWLKNWANQNPEGFSGGVPEAAGKYERGKWHGKISGRIHKMFPNGLTGGSGGYDLSADDIAKIEQQIANEAKATTTAARWAGPLSVLGKVGAGAGAAAGMWGAAKDFMNSDPVGGTLGTGATGLSYFLPAYGPLSAAAMQLYHDPEARQKFLESMKPEGAWSQRMEGRFGLD